MKPFHLVLSILIIMPGACRQQNIDAYIKNRPSALVNDHAKLLKPAELKLLERRLVDFDNRTTTQIAVLIVPTLYGRDIKETGTKIFNSWGIGTAQNSNGILILVAHKDRQIRVALGYGMEKAIPNDTVTAFIQRDIVPAFKEKRYFDGLDQLTQSLMAKALLFYPEKKQHQPDSVIRK